MNFYSKKEVNFISFILTIFVYLFLTMYIPKLFTTVKEYVYFKTQPNYYEDYENN